MFDLLLVIVAAGALLRSRRHQLSRSSWNISGCLIQRLNEVC